MSSKKDYKNISVTDENDPDFNDLANRPVKSSDQKQNTGGVRRGNNKGIAEEVENEEWTVVDPAPERQEEDSLEVKDREINNNEQSDKSEQDQFKNQHRENPASRSDRQKGVAQEAPQAGEEGDYPTEPDRSDVRVSPKRVNTQAHSNPSFIRIEPPSHLVPYDFDDIQIRKFKVSDLAKIYQAMSEGNFTLLVDAIDSTITQDARDLTVSDFYHLMYWQRINSYPKSPFIINWNSRYGNRNEYKVNNTNLQIKEFKLSEEEYQHYYDQGLTLPSVRDLEMLETEELNSEQMFLYNRAQYIVGDSIEEKVQKLDEYEDLSILELIDEFSEKTDHGVVESVEVQDQNFEPNRAIQVLREQATQLRNMVNNDQVTINDATQFINDAIDMEKEAEQIEQCVRKGEEYTPRTEEITLSIDALRFFPRNK